MKLPERIVKLNLKIPGKTIEPGRLVCQTPVENNPEKTSKNTRKIEPGRFMAQSDQLMAELGLTTLAAMETYSNAGFAGRQFLHEIWSVDSQITRLGYQWRRQSSSWLLVVSEEAVLLQR